MDTTFRQMATGRGRRALLLIALLMLLCAAGQRGRPAHAQQAPAAAQELCKLLPPGATVQPPQAKQEGGNLICGAAYPTPRDAKGQQGVGVILMDPAKVRELREEYARDINRPDRDPLESVILERKPPYGEFGWEAVGNFCVVPAVPPLGNAAAAVAAAEANRTQCKTWMFTSTFIRGCYGVFIIEIVDGEWQQTRNAVIAQFRERAQYIDARLKTMPPCPGAPAPATGPLTAGLACEQDRLSEGAVTCAASTTGQRADAEVVFEWTVDGKGHGERGNVLALSGLSPGKHGVSVRAKDTRNNVASNPESVSFTRADPAAAGSAATGPNAGTQGNPSAGPGGSGGGGGGSGGTIPLVAGGAAAIAGALAFLNHQRRNRARGGTALAPRPPAPPPAPPPSTRPEETRERRPRSPSPQIQVELLLAPSVRMQLLQRQYERSIWGDGADFCIAGYRITVLTPDWIQTLQPVDAKLTGDQPSDAAHLRSVESLGDPASFIGAEAQRRWKVRATWSRSSRQMPLTLTVTAQFRQQETSEIATATAQITPEPLTVIGAEPRMELYTDAPANADGSDWALIRPHLTLFGEPYTGGFELTQFEMTQDLSRYFFDPRMPEFAEPPPGHRYHDDPAARAGRQAVPLRCKFHLDDEHIQSISASGAHVTLRVQPTGRGAGDGQIRDEVDHVVAEHYRACRAQLTPADLTPAAPAAVHLRPSRVICESIEPERLPRFDASSDEMYRTRLKLRIVSATEQPVKGSDIRAGQPDGPLGKTIENWWLTFHFDPPTQEPLSRWDTQPGEFTAYPDEVDEDGYLAFAVVDGGQAYPYLDYDHWQAFYRADTRYLRGQCRAVKVKLHARFWDFDIVDRAGRPVEIFIGPPCKLYVYADPADEELYGHAFIGLIDEKGQNLRAGFFLEKPILGVDPAGGLLYMAGEMAAGVLVSGALVYGLSLIGGPIGAAVGVGATTMARTWKYAKIGAAAAGAVPGIVLVGAGTGVGGIRDDVGYQFTVCRAWDITRDEYLQARAVASEWKRRADLGELLYDSKTVGGDGNCVTFTEAVCTRLGITMPWKPDSGVEATARRLLSDPKYVARAIEGDPRREVNGSGGTAGFKHPWVYGPNVRPSNLPVTVLGVWTPPAPQSSVEQPYPITETGPR